MLPCFEILLGLDVVIFYGNDFAILYFQAAAEIDLCWDDSKDIYRGTEKRQISQRAYLDFLRKSAYGFVILLAAQLCVWDTTPEKKDQDGGIAVEEKTLELENTNGSGRRQARRAAKVTGG